MKKIAFFVEGLTEQLFLNKFIEEVYDNSTISISSIKVKGGNKIPISFTLISASAPLTAAQYTILIYNCGGDSSIRSYIMKQRMSLIKNGFSKVIGMTDLYPNFERTDFHKLDYSLRFRLPQTEIEIDFIINTMEIEASFLCEHTHFAKINPSLTPSLINTNLGFDPEKQNMELRDRPAEDLNKCYNLVGDEYTKESVNIKRTVDYLNYTELYFTHSNTYKALGKLKTELDLFLT